MKTLESLRELAYRSHSGTSFSPERRAESVVNDYSEELDGDLLKIQTQGASQEQVDRYKKGYIEKLSKYLHSHSNVMSSMITGPSNFPVARNQKRSNWADGHYNDFRAWREKVLKAYDRFEKNAKIEAAGGELGVAKNKYMNLVESQEYMKKINSAHKAYLKNPNSLLTSDLSEHAKRFVIEFTPQYSWIKHPFAPYQLTNNNAMIKNTKLRIEQLEMKEQKATGGNEEIPFSGGVVIMNYELDRIQISHKEKPEPAIIKELKSHGFRWSPHYKVWQRQITNNAKYVTFKLLIPKISIS